MTLSSLKLSAATGKRAAVLAATSLLAATALAGAALAQEVKIGIVGGISGPIAALAPPMIQASKLAVVPVNAQGGIMDGRKLVAVVGDLACSPAGGTEPRERVVDGNGGVGSVEHGVCRMIEKKN